MSAVFCFSFIERELCPLHPCALIIPCSLSMYCLVMVASSCPSKPVSFRIVKIIAYLRVDADMILSIFAVVGMIGIFRSHLYFGFVHWILLVWQNQL